MKRALLITYAYLIDQQNENVNADDQVFKFFKLDFKPTSYEKNITNQLNKIYSNLNVYEFYAPTSSTTNTSTSSISYNNTSYLYNNNNNNSSNSNSDLAVNDLKMLHFLLILFSSFLSVDLDEENNNNAEDTEIMMMNDQVVIDDLSEIVDGQNLNLDDDCLIGAEDFDLVQEMSAQQPASASLVELKTKANSLASKNLVKQTFCLDAFECQKLLLKLIDHLICNNKAIKTKILLSVSDLDIWTLFFNYVIVLIFRLCNYISVCFFYLAVF